ncbi:MAG: type II and III secretion system protein family protein [Desulfarculus sp.]|nr:type II and III secretion system protein family protein [Desulfarculus sp.]
MYPRACAALLVILALWAGATPGQAQSPAGQPVPLSRVEILVGHSRVLELPTAVKRVSVGKDDIADVVVINPRQLYVNAQQVGSTNISLWDTRDHLLAVYEVRVARDLSLLKEQLYQLLPHEPVEVREMQGTVVLSGRVSSLQAKEQAEALAKALVPSKELADGLYRVYADKGPGQASGKKTDERLASHLLEDKWVTSLLEVGGNQQVNIKVRFAEVKRDVTRRLKVNLGALNPLTGDFIFSTLGGLMTPTWDGSGNFTTSFSPNTNVFGGFNIGGGRMRGALDVLSQNQLAKILAEPTLTCISGQEADFLAGGEFPVPVPQQNNTVTIEFKKFGVQLGFKPEVLKSGNIRMNVSPEVSEMDFSIAVVIQGFTVPGLKTRRAKTQLEVKDGESFVIAGLFRDDINHQVSKLPLLGDIPILGALFRSTEFQNNQTELLIEVTPEVVKPVLAGAPARLPTDGITKPSDWDILLFGKMADEGAKRAPLPLTPQDMEGSFGHDPAY